MKANEFSSTYTILKGGSISRALLNDEILKMCRGLEGKILDIGSGKSRYKEIFGVNAKVVTTDINKDSGADLIFDANKKFPIKSDTFDYVFCMNVLEHLKEPENCIAEAYRVLKPGGTCFVGTPFMFQWHGIPGGDYQRFTSQGLYHRFEKAGFKQIEIKELGGRASVIAEFVSLCVPLEIFQATVRIMLWPLVYLLEKVKKGRSKTTPKRFYLMNFVKAKK